MNTLADMTREECVECVGMWVRYQTPLGDRLAVYEGENILYEPGCGPFTAPLHTITPLYDKPRAWNPDGTPSAGEWQTAKTKIALNENAKYDPEQNVITGDGVADPDHEPRSSHDIRRWVGEWEQA